MIKKNLICLNYGHFEKKLWSGIISQNHYLNKILDVHPLVCVHVHVHVLLLAKPFLAFCPRTCPSI